MKTEPLSLAYFGHFLPIFVFLKAGFGHFYVGLVIFVERVFEKKWPFWSNFWPFAHFLVTFGQ